MHESGHKSTPVHTALAPAVLLSWLVFSGFRKFTNSDNCVITRGVRASDSWQSPEEQPGEKLHANAIMQINMMPITMTVLPIAIKCADENTGVGESVDDGVEDDKYIIRIVDRDKSLTHS